jgi:cytochrome c-type biogenesis protein CcmE
MLKKLLIVVAVVGIPLVAFVASRFGEIPDVTLKQAIAASEQQSQTDAGRKVLIRARAVVDAQHSVQRSEQTIVEFFARDEQGNIFTVKYGGKDPIRSLENGQTVQVVGLMLSSSPATFQASQVLL